MKLGRSKFYGMVDKDVELGRSKLYGMDDKDVELGRSKASKLYGTVLAHSRTTILIKK